MTPRIEQIGNATLYLGDCREILPTISRVDAVVSDPPYGNKHSGDSTRFSGGRTRRGHGSSHGPIIGDGIAFDPRKFMLGKAQIFFGANYFLDLLKPGTLLIWSKRRPHAYGTFMGDGEVAWLSSGRGIYLKECIFAGSRPALEWCNDAYAKSAHPFQKPLAIMEWCISKLPKECNVILDPFMGSGTTGVAAIKSNRKFIGIEIEEKYFDIACKRISNEINRPNLFKQEEVAA